MFNKKFIKKKGGTLKLKKFLGSGAEEWLALTEKFLTESSQWDIFVW